MNTAKINGYPVELSESAKEAIRLTFNPSGVETVADIKTAAATFITLCEQAQKENPAAGRELAVAITNMQTASMWAVLGVTKGK